MIRTIGSVKSRPDPGAYKFTGRTLLAHPLTRGLYGNAVGFFILLEPLSGPADDYDRLMMEDGGALIQG